MSIDGYIRRDVESIIKEQQLDRSRIYEVSKLHYSGIIREIQTRFVDKGGNIHWSNMGYFNRNLPCRSLSINGRPLWYHDLDLIIPRPDEPVYVLLEDVKNYTAKYWLYEMYLPELKLVLDEISGLNDFYIVSRKYEWLISENHEDIISLIGSCLNAESLDINSMGI